MSKRSARDILKNRTIRVPQDRLVKPESENGKQSNAASVALGNAAVEKRVNQRLEYQSIKGDLHERLIDELNNAGMLIRPDEELKQYVEEFVAGVLETEDIPLNQAERIRLAEDLLEESLGSGPLAPLMGDPAIAGSPIKGASGPLPRDSSNKSSASRIRSAWLSGISSVSNTPATNSSTYCFNSSSGRISIPALFNSSIKRS